MRAAGARCAWLWAAVLRAAAGPQAVDQVQQEVRYIWPTAVWSLPLVGTSNDGSAKLGLPEGSEGDDVLYGKLAALGENGFERYRTVIMPMELKLDARFQEELGGAEDDGSHSRRARRPHNA
ncbi:unnamed protein product [Prorocentrum cordatum]|uniref:Uncharacterized protein n=1 Tax=Prorocentrum cordatum TaxID=2364126 RepID=A0ABN9PJS5_9DINO|nr:unnamed protein product [Polarella glacialis]